MKMITFAMSAVKTESPPFLQRLAENVNPTAAHVVGVGSGLTGVALWAEVARHLTVMVGLLVALMALFGGLFYAFYWAVKALRELRDYRGGKHGRRH